MTRDRKPTGGRLHDKVAIITGGGSGIGKAAAELFAAEGAKVMIADIDNTAGEAAVAHIRHAHGTSTFERTDVTSRESIETMAKRTVDLWGRIDVLYCNAGVYPATTIDRMTDADWDIVYRVNLESVFHCVRACLPTLRTQRSGSILLTSSVTGPITGYPGWAHYGATKAAVLGFMRSAALEIATDGITINAVMPGSVRMATFDPSLSEEARSTASYIPLGRLAEPRDIAYAALFLATPEASYITGQTLVIDGGQTLPEAPFWNVPDLTIPS